MDSLSDIIFAGSQDHKKGTFMSLENIPEKLAQVICFTWTAQVRRSKMWIFNNLIVEIVLLRFRIEVGYKIRTKWKQIVLVWVI